MSLLGLDCFQLEIIHMPKRCFRVANFAPLQSFALFFYWFVFSPLLICERDLYIRGNVHFSHMYFSQSFEFIETEPDSAGPS